MRIWLLVAGLSVLATAAPSALLTADRALLPGAPWALWTGPLRHADAGHLLRDLSGLLGLALMMRGRLRPGGPALLVLFGLPLPVIGALLGDPAAAGYYGVSGLVHALCVVALVDLSRSRPRLALVFAGALAAKLAWELTTGTLWVPLDGGRPAAWGHLVGALTGLALAQWSLAPAQRPKRMRRQATQRRISPMRCS